MLYYVFHRLSSCFTAGGKARAHTNGKPQGKKNGRNATKPARRKPYYAELRASCL